MQQLDLMPLIEQASRDDRNLDTLTIDLEYETDFLMHSKTDGLLVIGDTFFSGEDIQRTFELVGFQVKAMEMDSEPIFETYYQFENPAGEKSLMHTDKFIAKINNRELTAKAPDDCIFIMNSMIFGTPEFNEALKWDLIHYDL